jgi:glycolate oxidase FAD binding subunit
MVKQASLLSQLESIAGPDRVRPAEELPAFAVDGLTPQAAVAPSTYEQVADVIRYAHAERLAVIPWGGGSHMHIGNIPSRYDIALSLSRLDQIVEHEPADLTATCQAGITLAALQRRLRRDGQRVPLDPASAEGATIGGALAVNISGPSRHAYGALRDFTIGLRVVTGDGRLTRAGGRVVKNVAGYDLCKLYVGSLGTLGIIVEATFKLAPLPRARRTALASFETAAGACAFAAELQRRGLSLLGAQLLNPAAASTANLSPEGSYALVLALAGTPQAVERSHHEIGEMARDAPAGLAPVDDTVNIEGSLRQMASPSAAVLLFKATALPSRLPALIEALQTAGHPRIIAYPTVGILHASWPALDDVEEAVRRVRDATAGVGGSLVLEVCPPELKRQMDVFGDPPPSFDLMRRVKQEFDPAGVLSPGRFLGRL